MSNSAEGQKRRKKVAKINFVKQLEGWGFTVESGRGKPYRLEWTNDGYPGLICLSGKEIRNVFEQSPTDLNSFLNTYETLFYEKLNSDSGV